MAPPSLQRVFVGIKISPEIAEACAKLQADLGNFPARFIPPEDLHLTLVPPWQMKDQKPVENTLRHALKPIKRFTLKFQRLLLGPNNTRPRFIWIECEASEELIKLKTSLMKSFHIPERVPFSPHITLARIPIQNMREARRRDIQRQLGLSMAVESVELFASVHKEGVGYRVLASMPIPSNEFISR